MRVTLGAGKKCSFLGGGNVQLNWEPYYDYIHYKTYNKPVWAKVLNYSHGSCYLYGGDTVEQAWRNVTPGQWLKREDNCAYYVIVGNNLPGTLQATFTFQRTVASTLVAGVACLFALLSLSL